ncbi:extracellular solute-binding protein [Actinomadura luteofluorescens]|uniref:extracellular solute-binding protein n=1 Tax=Actinomadura luteofluorescens TaxID=46163 RepID=UPI003640D0FB
MALALLAGGLTACGDDGGTPKLTWYVNPDNGGQAALAKSCTQAAGGRYRIETSLLPSDATQQREQLIRRLAAKDSGLDLMSLDPVFVAEAANAGFLRPFTKGEAAPLTDGVFAPAVQSSMWEGRLYAAPFWANTQLLWYRKSVAKKAGIDPNAADFTWDKLLDAAVRTNTTIGVQGNRYEGYMVWINALIASAGGRIISDAEKGDDARIDIDSPAAKQAASIIRRLARSSAASPTLSTDIEEQSRATINARAAASCSTGATSGGPRRATPTRAPSARTSSATSAGPATRGSTRGSRASRPSGASRSGSARTASTRPSPSRRPGASPHRPT